MSVRNDQNEHSGSDQPRLNEKQDLAGDHFEYLLEESDQLSEDAELVEEVEYSERELGEETRLLIEDENETYMSTHYDLKESELSTMVNEVSEKDNVEEGQEILKVHKNKGTYVQRAGAKGKLLDVDPGYVLQKLD